jgi:DNA-binding CsgD family transcriptional regulator
VKIVGREKELGRITGFLDGLKGGPRALLVEGEAGIGKTVVWAAVVDVGRARGLRTLCARPAGSEVKLSFSGLGDLMEPVLDDALPALPPPQARALEIALLRREARGAPDRRAVGLALLAVVRLLSHDGPLIVAVDDLQWLDRPSGRVLEFTLRRLRTEPVGLFATVRASPGGSIPFDLDRALAEESTQRVALGPLTLGALHELLRSRLGLNLPRPKLVRVHEACGGNPFFALELARELQRQGLELAPGQPLPLSDNLRALVGRRIGRLPERVRDLLLVAAALSNPTVPVLAAVTGDSDQVEAGLERALRAGVIELQGESVRFSHPLLASVSYGAASPRRRRDVHGRSAKAVADVEERARHLALAARGPDAAVAGALDEACKAAAARGAPDAAADLSEQAARLTPSADVDWQRRRRREAARYAFIAGDTARARRLLEELLEELPAGAERARALLVLANILHPGESTEAATAACEQALREPVEDPGLKAEIHAALAQFVDHDNPRRAKHAQVALELLTRAKERDSRVEASALVAFAAARYYLGEGVDVAALERAIRLEEGLEPRRAAWRASTVLGQWLKYADDFDRARPLLESGYRVAQEEGDDSSLPDVVAHLAELELWAGNWELAERYAGECLEAAERTEQEMSRVVNRYVCGLVDAHFGRTESARAYAREALVMSERMENAWGVGISLWVLGFLDLTLGDLAAVDAHLRRADEVADAIGLREPGQWRFHADHIEALIGLGELTRAAALLERLEERGRVVDRPWALATAARCRGLLLEARGAGDEAAAAFDDALGKHERLPMPFELGRTLLARGSVQRRAWQKRAARESLERALAIFDRLGAQLWSGKVRTELGRIGGRRAPRGAALSATEAAIVELVSAGRTNQEVAAALSLSPRTIQWNLSKVYRRLGVRSRTELAAALGERGKA